VLQIKFKIHKENTDQKSVFLLTSVSVERAKETNFTIFMSTAELHMTTTMVLFMLGNEDP
jgi:hypothetical protein